MVFVKKEAGPVYLGHIVKVVKITENVFMKYNFSGTDFIKRVEMVFFKIE
jgi:hypothetical protein